MSEPREIYLDYAATSPVDPAVADAMDQCLRGAPANPASTHAAGRRARGLVDTARAQVAARVGATANRLVFTSGATEANNLALKGWLLRAGGERPHLVTSRIEHKSVLDTARAAERAGVKVTYVEPDRTGTVPAERIAAALRPDTALVSIMHVNNETGAVQDIPAIAALCRERGVRLHVDAAQSAGKIEIAVEEWGVHLCSLSAHKLCGPKGVGALYVAADMALEPQMHGGEQEHGLRAGTLATHQLVGMGVAYALADPAVEGPRLAALRDRLWAALEAAVPGIRLNGASARRAPHVLNVSFPGVEGESLRFALRDLAVSAGSACAADSPEASHVLTSMGLSETLAASSLRLSVGRFTTESEIDRAAARIAAEATRLRTLAAAAPAWCSA